MLLGGLALAGLNSKKETNSKKNNIKSNKLNNKYHSNTFDTMKQIERNQASILINSIKNNKPEYFSQFDELKFDNISTPVPINESHITITGVNQNLQRDIDLHNGYSGVEDGLNYGVIAKEHFTHNNMTPNTSKRDYTIDGDRSSRKLEAFTGVSDFYVPKQEKVPLFEPMKNLTYVNGMPVMTDYLDDRYLASNKNNNGNLPFQNNVLVRPGLDGEIRNGLGTVYRVVPRNVDALRSENNQKISYLNKPLETIKKGEFRGPDYNITKYKLPDFREQTVDDLVQGRFVNEGPIQTGKFTDINTQRGENEIDYTGPAYNINMGNGPSKSKTCFEPSKRMEGYNDPTHAINAVNVRPVFQNKNSFANNDNQRTTTSNIEPSNVISQNQGNYVFSKDYVLPTTIRETTSHNFVLGPKAENNAGIASITDKAKKTIKETTLSNTPALNFTPNVKLGVVKDYINDIAKKTIKETTSIQTPTSNLAPNTTLGYIKDFINDIAKTTINQLTLTQTPALNLAPNVINGYVKDDTDIAKPTIKQTTLIQTPISNLAPNVNNGYVKDDTDVAKKTIRQTTIIQTPCINPAPNVTNSYVKDVNDKAKPTIKQTTLIQTPVANPAPNVTNGYSRDEKDKAKPTIKQTTENNTYESGLHGVDNYAGYSRDEKDIAKPTIKQTTENNTYESGLHGVDNYAGYTDIDALRTTIKQTTLLTDYTGGLAGEVNQQISHLATDNMEIDDRRQYTTYNRPANGGKNVAGPQINKDTMKYNIKKTSIYYVSNPGKPLDNNVMPGADQPYKDKVFKNVKPQLSYGDYSTNNNFINTLKDNPLVNDIYHQKNV